MRLIDADALMEWFKAKMALWPNVDEVLDEISDAPTVTASYEDGEYDTLDLLAGAWHGKQYYFKERNGMIYSRDTCQYMTLDEAITEFMNRLGDDGSI